jgi:4-hydroxythreonine-4-phosphate dehydrogenase
MSETVTPRVAITTGEPAGIGPQVSLAAALARRGAPERIVLVGDARLLASRARKHGIGVALTAYDGARSPPAGTLEVIDVPLAAPCHPGHPDARNAPAVIAMLDRAIDATVNGDFDVMVTAPLQKSVINDAGIAFSGHTEYLAQRTGAGRVVMMLVGGGLRVALATTHLPLAAVSAAITTDLLTDVLRVLDRDLRGAFGVVAPRLLVCGLNPHAGEAGYLGREEIERIAPALERARGLGIDAQGPLPADTLFQPKFLAQCDAVLAMYHDQGLPVLKYASFGQGVNVTLGLPIVRTSVDHGTALDIAASDDFDYGSMSAAIEVGLSMALHRAHRGARRA